MMSLNKLLFTFLFILFAVVSSSQNHKICNELLENENIFEINASYEMNSSAITNEFMFEYATGSYLDENLKKKSIDRLKSDNLFGSYLNPKTFFYQNRDTLFGISNAGFFIGFEHHNINEILFNKDMFKLFFMGNSAYAGKTADLNDMNYNQLSYQQLKLGIYKRINAKNDNHIIGFAAAFNKGFCCGDK